MFRFFNLFTSTKCCRRAGLTLMELVVVMVILIALAGILLPLFPGMLTRGHTSSAATNLSELSKAVQEYYYQDLQLPYNLDNVAPLAGVANPANPAVTSLVAAYPGTYSTPDLIKQALGANDLAMLQAAGMNYALQTMVPTGTPTNWSPTYNPYSDASAIGSTFYPQNQTTGSPAGVSTLLANLTTVLYVSGAAAARELAQPPTGTYVMFGAGDYSSMSGKTLQTAPIHFDDAATGEPNVAYCRFGLVFKTTGDGTYTDLPSAQFVGAVDLGDSSGITSIQDHIQGYLNTK